MNRRLSEVDKGLEGCQDCRCFIVMLQLISLGLLAALLTVILVKGTENPHSQDYDQEKEHIHQELKQLKDGLDRLCHPCPWDWTLFQGNCYFLSTFQQTWKESLNTCREVGAQLVVVKNDEEQRFLHWISMKKRKTWMGLSDSMKEGQWQWVDGSPLQWRISEEIGSKNSEHRWRNGPTDEGSCCLYDLHLIPGANMVEEDA